MNSARVGTLNTLGLAVYVRADGTHYFMDDGERQDVHGLSVFNAQVEKVTLMGRLIRDFAANVLDMEGPLPATTFANSRLFSDEEAEALTRLLETSGEGEAGDRS